MKLIFLHIILVSSIFGLSQNAKSDFEMALKTFRETPSSKVTVSTNVFADKSKTNSVYTIKATLIKKGDNVKKIINESTTLKFGKSILLLDSQNKLIQYHDYSKVKEKDYFDEASMLTDTLLEMYCSKMKFIKTQSGKNYYELLNFGDFSRVVLSFDIQKKFFSKIEYYYKKDLYPSNNVVVLNYSFIPNYSVSDSTFLLGTYITGEGKKYKGVGTYKNYLVEYYNDAEFLKSIR